MHYNVAYGDRPETHVPLRLPLIMLLKLSAGSLVGLHGVYITTETCFYLLL